MRTHPLVKARPTTHPHPTSQRTDIAISAHFRHTGFTPEKYDEAIRRLDAAGHDAPTRRLEHIAIETNGEIDVLDIWESPQALEAWGPQRFVPILLDLGVELHPPTIHPVRNVIRA